MSSTVASRTASPFLIFARLWGCLPNGMRRALVPFAMSRLMVLLIFAAVPLIAQVPVQQWGHDDSTTIKLTGSSMSDGLRRLSQANDAAWYFGIAKDGYEQRAFDTSKQANWAFFPLHPLLWRAAATATGEWFWSGVILANLLAFAGLSMLWQLALKLTQSAKVADDAVLFASFWPSSYFMMLPHTESLFFALVTLSFLAVYIQRWWLAGLAGMLAGATRFNGLFLAPALFVKWMKSERRFRDLMTLAPIGLGIAAFMFYLWTITGNPLAFKDIQVAWMRELKAPWVALLDYTSRPSHIIVPWNPKLLHFPITVLGIVSAVTCWKRGWRGLAVFTALTLLAPLATGTLISITRYLGVAPGVYMALAVWSEKHPRFGQLCLALFAIAMALLCTLFAAGINVGGA
ncbi:hypothetical protein FHW69_003495 [Luteibacter sp. Sphag1AF]|uniref:hypothetical protein n=1 Tax=Luteibacter sp. Sphag1AF TaxID=2587031 RepID=UPI001610E066|nr:hypothetical protein [Luteibacter sp. Sphag1AF]MBB3228850.1 hypothetical protein [Luteibacter sp. Sphag1AF]